MHIPTFDANLYTGFSHRRIRRSRTLQSESRVVTMAFGERPDPKTCFVLLGALLIPMDSYKTRTWLVFEQEQSIHVCELRNIVPLDILEAN